MTAGKWRFTGAPVSFDEDGVLADGQHRLLAVVKSYTVQRFLVVVGLAPEAMGVIDTGTKRNVSDVLQMTSGMSNASTVSAVARVAVQMQQGSMNDNGQVTATEVMDWIADHEDVAEHVRRALSMRKHADVSTALLGYAMWRLAQVDEPAAAEFFADWRDLRTTGRGDPLAALLQRLRSAKDSRERLPRAAVVSMIFRAWNARRSGAQLKQMQAVGSGGRIDIPEPK